MRAWSGWRQWSIVAGVMVAMIVAVAAFYLLFEVNGLWDDVANCAPEEINCL